MEMLLMVTVVIVVLILICTILIFMWILRKRRRYSLSNIDAEDSTFYKESQAILAALPVGIAIYDKNARQEYINDAVATIFGVTDREAHVAKRISLYDDPALKDEIKELIRKGVDVDTVVEYDIRKAVETSYFSTDFSHVMYIDGKIRYVKNKKGKIEKYILIINDITENRIHELKLQRSEINLKLALETGGVDVCGYDIDKGCFYPVYGKMLTYEGADINEVSKSMHEECRGKFIEMMSDLLSGKIKESSLLNRMINASGRDKYYETRILAVCDGAGRVETLLVSHKDITEDYYHKQTLEESLFKTKLAIKTSGIAQWDYDCSTGFFDVVNDPLVLNKKNITSEDYLKLIHEQDKELVIDSFRKMEERQDLEFCSEIRMKYSDSGGWQYVTIHGAPIKDNDGNVFKYTGFRQNNTKFIELNKRLEESNIHLNMVLRAGDIIPTVVDPESDIVYLSSVQSVGGEVRVYEKTLKDLVSNIHQEDRPRILAMMNDIKSGVIENFHEECRYADRGEFTVYDLNYIGLDYEKNGRPHKIVGYFQNITERKKIETHIKRQKEFLNSIFDKIPVPVHIKDVEDGGKYIYWNNANREIFGDGLFKTAQAIVGQECAREMEAVDRKVFDTENPYVGEEKLMTVDGRVCDTVVHKSVIHEGDRKLLLVVRWDVSIKNELQRKSKILSISMNALKAYTWYCDLRDNILRFGNEFENRNNPDDMNSMVKFAQKIHPDHRDMFIDLMNDFCKRDGGDFSVEYQIDFSGDGNYEWWESRGTMEIVNSANESYKYLYGMDINVDNHKRTELAILGNKTELDALNKQNELILNNTNSGLVFLDDDFVVQWENLSAFMPNHPMTKNYKKGMVCHKAVHGLDSPCPGCIVLRSKNSGKIEIKEISAHGNIAELTATPIYDDPGNRVGTVLKVVDITESKTIHVELEAAKNRAEVANVLMKNIIDRLPCLLFIKDVDNDYRHVMVNKYFCDVQGLTVEDIIGKTDYDLFPTKEEADRCRMDDIIAVEGDKLHIYEEVTHFQGKRIVWQTTKSAIRTVDGRHLMIAISLDITSKMLAYDELQEAKEKAEQSNRLKSAFLANMSHEIRTPLNAIVGFSQLMGDPTIDAAEKGEYYHMINTNNELLLRLINDILDLSKIEAGMMELKPVRFDVADLFGELFAMFEKRVVSDDVQLVCVSPYKSCFVQMDRNRFIQVISNFLSNAIKFTTKGQITMSYEYVDGGLKTVVSDTGIGIAKDKLDKVFERFEKLDNFTQGTGLGMAICKAIVEAYHGEIGVESECGKGTTFWAWIPIDAAID